MPDQVTLARQIDDLGHAIALSRGRVDPALLADAEAAIHRVGERVATSGDRTVVALVGATGSGKSSLFNALTGTDWARVAVRRPTTQEAMAASWGADVPHALLDWLGISSRRVVADAGDGLDGLVLVDLPDYDSIETWHRETVDRLVATVDALIWVVDPEKYADATLHHDYLRRLATHADVMLVVFNKTDLLAPGDVRTCVFDLRKLLDADGLRDSPIMATSVAHGEGIDELRAALSRMVTAKIAMVNRLSADVRSAARALAATFRPGSAPVVNRRSVAALVTALGDVTGVPVAVDAVRAAWLRRGRLATGWPLSSWIARLKPDPLRRLRSSGSDEGTSIRRTSLPKGGVVQQAMVDRRLRELADSITEQLPSGWAEPVSQAVFADRELIVDDIDAMIANVGWRREGGAWWWPVFRAAQWLLVVAALAGGLWLLSGPVCASLRLPPVPDVFVLDVPLASWLLVGGVVLGVGLGLLGRLLVAASARAMAAAARRRLEEQIALLADHRIVGAAQTELDRYTSALRAVRSVR